MSRGRQPSTSTSAYKDNRNDAVKNKRFVSNSLNRIKKVNEAIDKHCEEKRKEFVNNGLNEIEITNNLEIIRRRKFRLRKGLFKHLVNSDGLISLTRDHKSLSDREARRRFHNFVKGFEDAYEISLSNTSKEEIVFIMFNYFEETNSVIKTKDDSEKFFLFRFLIADAIKIYLYKVFYPRVFDYDIKSGKDTDEEVVFKSNFIEANFKIIYEQIEELINSIIYDGFLMSTTELCTEYIFSLKNCDIYFSIKEGIKTIKEDILEQVNSKTQADSRIGILKYFIPSAIFLAKFHGETYSSRENINNKKITTILDTDAFYEGSRATESRKGIHKASNVCHDMLDENFNFSRLLNLQHINEKTGLLDLNIIRTNYEFKPYLLPGIVVKHHINEMILTNSDMLSKPEDAEINNDEDTRLVSIYNNPNCLVKNIALRDYEILNYIITKVALSMRVYYLINKDKDIVPKTIVELVDTLDSEEYTTTMSKKVCMPNNAYFDKIDFEEVSAFKVKTTKTKSGD